MPEDEIKFKLKIEIGLIPYCKNKEINYNDLACEIAFLMEKEHPNFRGYIKIDNETTELFNNPLCSICNEPLLKEIFIIKRDKIICGSCYK